MSDDMTRLQGIEERCQRLDPGPWAWRQCYEIGNRVHWALESPKSAADGKVVSYLAVLRHCYPKSSGESVEDDPYLSFIAHSRDDIVWLCQRVRAALEVAPLPGEPSGPDWSFAPDWAQWWTCSAHGDIWWWDEEPQITGSCWCKWDKGKHQEQYASTINIPLGIDWRLLKVQRPVGSRVAQQIEEQS